MSRRGEAKGGDLRATITAAVADLFEVEEAAVTIELTIEGVELETAGDAVVRLELPAAAPVTSATDAEDEAPAAAEDDADEQDDDETDEPDTNAESEPDLDEEADAAADFLEGLLDALDLPGDLRISIHPDHAEVEIVEVGTGSLIGRRGQTLEAIQELVRCVLQREFQRRTRVKVDVEAYRRRRLEKLLDKAEDAIDEVLDTGESVRLEPMDVFERKAVHRLVAEVDGVSSRSQGREPGRRVIIETS